MNRIPNSLAHRSTRSQGNGQNASQLKHTKSSAEAGHGKKGAKKALPAKLEGSFAAEQRRINQGVANGSLTTAEAQQLQGKLDTLHARFAQDAFEKHGGEKGKLGAYGQELRQLDTQVTTAAKNDDVDASKASSHVDARITAGLADGTLTATEAGALKQKADALKLELALAATPADQKAVAQKLRALDEEVSTERKDDEFDAGKRKESFATRIVAGLTDGSLTAKEASRLLERVSKLGGAQGGAYEATSRDIFQLRHNGEVNRASMGTSLKGRVAALETAGKLTAEQAAAYRSSLDAMLGKHGHASGMRLSALRDRLAAYV